MTRWTRVSRGLIAASVSTFIAVLSHQAAGGALPSALGITLCLVFCALVCIPLAGKRVSPVRLAAAVAASQAMFHGFFGLLSSPTAYSAPVGPHVHGAIAIPVGGDTAVMVMDHTTLPMLLAHLGAAALTFIVLNYGERAVVSLYLLWSLAMARVVTSIQEAIALPSCAGRTAPQATAIRPRVALRMLRVMRHRGPPIAVPA